MVNSVLLVSIHFLPLEIPQNVIFPNLFDCLLFPLPFSQTKTDSGLVFALWQILEKLFNFTKTQFLGFLICRQGIIRSISQEVSVGAKKS